MARYRLRYQGTDFELPPGEFVIGRSSSCNLALDDGLVSRRHAVIHVADGAALLEDLGSRNGVLANGERIEGRRKLGHLDRVTIGSHDLIIVEVRERPLTITCDQCQTVVHADAVRCPKCGMHFGKGAPTLVGLTLELPAMTTPPPPDAIAAPRDAGGGEEHTGRTLVSGIADKALALGRYDEAERVLARGLQELLQRSKAGVTPPTARLDEGVRYGLRLAEGTRRAQWLDWLFDVHTASGRLMSADEIERLHDLVRRARYTGVGPVRRYVESIRARAHELSAAERFQLSRLEGIERMVGA